MKNLSVSALVLSTVLSAGVLGGTPASADVSVELFHSRLSPHGSWMVSARYGNVWQPAVARPDWNPYYDGHWEYTDVGQTWVSDYPWGAIPYHYGTWAWEPRTGWVWVPGTTWAPAWVVFRSGPDYIGWAPVSPGFTVGLSMEFGDDDYDGDHFVFVPSRDFFAPRVRTIVVPASRTKIVVNKTKIVTNNIRIENNVVVNKGPSLTELRRATGRPIKVSRLEEVRGLGPHVKRQEIRVDAERARHGLKAAGGPEGSRGTRLDDRDRRAERGDRDRDLRTDRDARRDRDGGDRDSGRDRAVRGDHDVRSDQAQSARSERRAEIENYGAGPEDRQVRERARRDIETDGRQDDIKGISGRRGEARQERERGDSRAPRMREDAKASARGSADETVRRERGSRTAGHAEESRGTADKTKAGKSRERSREKRGEDEGSGQ